MIDDLIESVKVAEQHIAEESASVTARANVQAYAMYVNEYVRPQARVHEVA
jgi:hypothetical protein